MPDVNLIATPQRRPWQAQVVTLFPEVFPGPLATGLIGRALTDGIWNITTVDLRDCANDKHRTVDDTPFGGGPGMVLRADVMANALDQVLAKHHGFPVLYPSARGWPLTQLRVRELAAGPGVIMLCGRYEGIDQRVLDARQVEEVAIGEFVLAGGELPTMAIIESAVRLLPGVLGNAASVEDESFSAGLLEYPHYTRPAEWEGHAVPEPLRSGDHGRIAEWRRQQAAETTRLRRPAMWAEYKRGKDSSR